MQKRFIFPLLALMMALVGAVFWVGRSSAATGCFSDTNNHWAESFICWMKTNNISTGYPDGTFKPENAITRAETSALLKKLFDMMLTSSQTQANAAETNAKNYADSLVNVPPSNGLIYVTTDSSAWLLANENQSGSIILKREKSFLTVANTTSNAVNTTLVMPVSLPTALYGKSLQLVGAEVCYSASLSYYLKAVEIVVTVNNTGIGSIPSSNQYSDLITHIDTSCNYYTFPTPVLLSAENSAAIYVTYTIFGTYQAFLGRTTFVLQPTSTDAILPSVAPENSIMLENSDMQSTSPQP
ncbi:MAG TPA: S-layer homology domain-containing protein [Anaerolineales bacterium]|nr:S-layer homology domain-containing protein [Anaerolineales bacterium]HNA90370.1 S-layer homology domain-containing protein [Anaerolineales bacterium]HNB36867.1 S-layer homology domain-containing protein [Anaerolineales bacterium]